MAHRRHALGPGRYETLHLAGELDDRPVRHVQRARRGRHWGSAHPTEAYVTTMIRGLRTTHGLSADAIVDYLLSADGITATGDGEAWDHQSLSTLVTSLSLSP